MTELLRARTLLDAFITLFRGGDEEVLARLLVLREIGRHGEVPFWTPQALQAHFVYLNPVKLDTVLKRLRENGLLCWEGEDGGYRLSEPGRVALAALAALLNFSEADAELGYLTAQVAGQQQLGRVSHEALQHLLGRLNELYRYFADALESQSEHQIRKAQARLEAVWRWVEQGTEVMHRLLDDPELDRRALDQAQAIALAQSRVLRLTGSFQRRLNQLQAQRVHLGQSGLTSSDIGEWLRAVPQKQLAGLAAGMLHFLPQPAFATGAELLDIAEHELLERDRPPPAEAALPQIDRAPEVAAPEAERLYQAERLFEELTALSGPVPLHQAVLAASYPETAYRLSLLSLLGDAEAAAEASVVAEIVKLPLSLRIEAAVDLLDHPEVASISRGRVEGNTR
ncbi:hypothetical protein [Chitinimonas lacunae]|uniref:Uncharacterized protein n=1 Tax=Chitinimonas lacunae TaxID=1963018 RepID=A0ABV8MSD1_9NEIS